eukprot:768786-Hanusia_phi.AAC.2
MKDTHTPSQKTSAFGNQRTTNATQIVARHINTKEAVSLIRHRLLSLSMLLRIPPSVVYPSSSSSSLSSP